MAREALGYDSSWTVTTAKKTLVLFSRFVWSFGFIDSGIS